MSSIQVAGTWTTLALLLAACQLVAGEREPTTEVAECYPLEEDDSRVCQDDVCPDERESPEESELRIPILLPAGSHCRLDAPYRSVGTASARGWSEQQYANSVTVEEQDGDCLLRIETRLEPATASQGLTRPTQVSICEPIYASAHAATLEEHWGVLESLRVQGVETLAFPKRAAVVATGAEAADGCSPQAHSREGMVLIESTLRIPMPSWRFVELSSEGAPFVFGLGLRLQAQPTP